MITYERLSARPQLAGSLLGVPLEEFNRLYSEFESIYRARQGSSPYTRQHNRRQRAAGAGPKHKYSLRDRLVMTLFWLRAYTTYELLGTLYDLDKTTVQDNLNDVLDNLSRIPTVHIEHPHAEIPKLHSIQELLDAFPDARAEIEACARLTKRWREPQP